MILEERIDEMKRDGEDPKKPISRLRLSAIYWSLGDVARLEILRFVRGELTDCLDRHLARRVN